MKSDFFCHLTDSASGGVYIIAEACDNHMGSIDMAMALVDAAKKARADAAKFQHHIVDAEMLPTKEMSDNFDEPLENFLNRNALSLCDHKQLKSYCDELGIAYVCTPFSWQAAIEIAPFVDFFKIGSGEFQDYWFVDRLFDMGKPTIFSSGMCTIDEILNWLLRYEDRNMDFAILNCTSEYPPRFEDLNLRFINVLKNHPNRVIGHSDHTQSISSSVSAVTLCARIVEKHMTLSHFVSGPDATVSLDPIEFEMLVKELRTVRDTLGEKKEIQDNEKPVRNWAYRSVVSTRDIESGEIISGDDICTKRPGDGIPSARYEEIIGKKAIRRIVSNQMIEWSDVE